MNIDYEEIEAAIKAMPATWYPAMLIACARAAYKKNVFLPGGASGMIRKLEAKELSDADIRCDTRPCGEELSE